jgi:hypothetical protein
VPTQSLYLEAVVALKPCPQSTVQLIGLVGQYRICCTPLCCIFFTVALAHLRCTQLFVSVTVAGTLPGPLAQNLAAQSSGNHMLPEALQRRIRDEQQRMWGHISAKQNSSGAGNVKEAGMRRAWRGIKLVCWNLFGSVFNIRPGAAEAESIYIFYTYSAYSVNFSAVVYSSQAFHTHSTCNTPPLRPHVSFPTFPLEGLASRCSRRT